ncbi:endo-1,4-beta-xylanase [Dactylosporangium sp. AC04546]|uniref:endo-1,4-beta-xylanase n=1 Tax=Dactylosporangium sp. AC04546 TaxID=2862460 RepID=UPI001EE0821B|nr:endo-1,4-beta-xylanase [Dactylosporangium sp. AC04546]WVK87395.1 endo-1,4-beta-xylanase [Dactylosporangium sp. AC04546]
MTGPHGADVTLTVSLGGAPLRAAEVVVEQLNHKTLFGCTGFELIDHANGARDDTPLAERWLALFNAATLPYYWGQYEHTDRVLTAARWFRDRGVAVKGHPLAWHTETAPWLLGLSVEEVAAAQRERITREVTAGAGVIDTWDVINEVVIMPIFDKEDNGITRLCRAIGRIPMIRLAFDAARAANPHATLLLNDFDMSAAYECLIEGVLAAGIAIDALGLQSHMHQGHWGEEKTLDVLERFARYGLPLHFTETTLVSGDLMPASIVDLNDFRVPSWPSTPEGEERQADEIVRHYRTLMAHPAVEAVTYWGLPDGGWLGAPGGLLRADGTPKPAFDALHGLVRGEWWVPPTALGTDERGRVHFTAFPGLYRVGLPNGSSASFAVDHRGKALIDVIV